MTHLNRTPRRKRDFNAAVGGDSGTSHSTEGPSTIVSDQDSQAQLSRFVARVMPTSDTGWEQSRGWQTGRRASAEGSGARRPPRLLPADGGWCGQTFQWLQRRQESGFLHQISKVL